MTKKTKLIWRLREQPSTESLQGLVMTKILTKDEARDILFNLQTEEDRDKKSLQLEIKFLRELVEKLSKSRSRIVEVIREVEVPKYRECPWYGQYYSWCGTATTIEGLTCGTTTGASIDGITLTGSTGTNLATASNTDFSDISTF